MLEYVNPTIPIVHIIIYLNILFIFILLMIVNKLLVMNIQGKNHNAGANGIFSISVGKNKTAYSLLIKAPLKNIR